MTQDEIEAALIEYVKNKDWVTFAELYHHFPDPAVLTGDGALCLGANDNLVVWAGMSPEFIAAVNALLTKRELFLHPVETYVGGLPLCYLADGKLLTLPIAKRTNVRKPHWVPALLRCVPYGKKRLTG